MKLVLIEWEDSRGPNGWQNLSYYRKPGNLNCTSVGWIVQEGKSSKTLAPHVSFDDDKQLSNGNGIMEIPASAIRKIIELRKK